MFKIGDKVRGIGEHDFKDIDGYIGVIVARFCEDEPVWLVDFGKDFDAPKMLSENSLFFTTNGIDIRDNSTYYQASFGKMLNSKDKDERKKLRGKPFADCCVSVIELNKPDPVINNIIDIVANHFPSTGVIECNLAYQTRQAV